jgi:outer membrane protein OmpA-like peptidoglycan-associated protein
VGLSSSHPLKLADGAEDAERSRRVTFRVISNSENQIKQILQQHP